MRKSYKWLVRLMPIFFLAIIVGAGLGIFTFNYDYDAAAGWLYLTYLSVSFTIVIVAGFALAVAGGIFARNSKVVRFKDSYSFSRFASVLLALITFALFLLEFYKLIMLGAIGFWRTVRMFLALGASVNFLFVALRKRFVSRHIPKSVRVAFSIVAVLWAVSSVFSIYFAQNSVSLSNIVKILLLLSYLSITVFMLFEAKFRYIKPCHIAYTLSALATAVFGCAICFPIAISIGTGKLAVDYTVMEFTVCFVVGIYAISRVCAMISTIRYTIDIRQENDDMMPSSISKKAEDAELENNVQNASCEEPIKDEKPANKPAESQKKPTTPTHKPKYSQYSKGKKNGVKKSSAKHKK